MLEKMKENYRENEDHLEILYGASMMVLELRAHQWKFENGQEIAVIGVCFVQLYEPLMTEDKIVPKDWNLLDGSKGKIIAEILIPNVRSLEVINEFFSTLHRKVSKATDPFGDLLKHMHDSENQDVDMPDVSE